MKIKTKHKTKRKKDRDRLRKTDRKKPNKKEERNEMDKEETELKHDKPDRGFTISMLCYARFCYSSSYQFQLVCHTIFSYLQTTESNF